MPTSAALPNTNRAHYRAHCSSLARVTSCGLLVALVSAPAHGQTTLNATYTSTPWDNTAALATGSGLTINLGLGVEYLLVGGGGSGGGGHAGGGGGGGGVLTGSKPVTAGTYFIGIGTGGNQSTGRGNNGTNTTAFDLTANGGGGGAGELSGDTARSGGSGGGGSGSNLTANRAGASGTAGQGTNGGDGGLVTLSYGVGGGGGGAATSGSDATSTQAGNGGAGLTSTITGTPQDFGGGGGGGGWSSQGAAAGAGGVGGGGAGADASGTSIGVAGTANTGGGGGGSSAQASSRTGGAGGSGIVTFRYQSSTRLASGGDTNGTTGVWQYETVRSSKNVTLTYTAANLLATQSGVITGTGGLTYNSPGTLALTAANTFSGTTRVQAGTLNLAHVNSLQSSTLDMNAADVGSVGFAVAGTATYALGGLQGSRSLDLGSNSLTLGGNGASTTYSGNLSVGGTLTKTGVGTLTLSGSNTLPSGLSLDAGTLALGSAGAIDSSGTIAFNGGTLRSSAVNTTDYSARFATSAGQQYRIDTADQSIAIATALTSTGGSLVKTGAGTLTLSGANSYSGGTTVSAGRLIGTTTSLQGAITNDSILRFDQATAGTFFGTISGSGAVEKNGSGTVVLAAANSHAGGTTVNAGTLAVTANGGLGTPGVTPGVIFGTGAGANPATGTARDANWTMVAVPSTWTPPEAVPYPAYVVQTVASTYVGGNNGSNVQNGYTANGTTSYWIAPQSTINALVGGNYNWIVAQEFNVVRDGVYDFSFGGAGDDQISFFIDGTVNTSNSVLPVITGGTQIGSTWASFNTIGTLTGTANLLAGTHTAYMVLNDLGGGTGAIITPGSFTAPEGTIVKAGGTLDLQNVAYTTADLITLEAATLAASTGTSSWAGDVVMTGASTVAVDGTGLSIAGVVSGAYALTKSGNGTLVLSGANTFSGGTTVSAGTLVGSVSSIPGNVANGSVLEFAQSVDATFAAVVSGAGSLTKSGAGNLVLSAAQTYAGGTSVTAGRLSVNNSLASPAVTVSGGTLGGSGSLAGTVAVQNGGTLAPGNSIESLSAGATSFASGATFAYEVDSRLLGNLAAAADLQVVNGNLDIASGALLTFTDLNPSPAAFVEDTTIFALFNYSGTWNGGLFTFGTNELADGERFAVGSQLWEIDYNSSTAGLNFTTDYVGSNFVTVTAVPEPGTLVLVAAAAGLAAILRRRRAAQARQTV